MEVEFSSASNVVHVQYDSGKYIEILNSLPQLETFPILLYIAQARVGM